jgi:feruloyl esterase
MGDAQSMLAQDVDPDTGRVGDKLLDQVDQTFGPGETKNVLRLMTFIQQDRKMILYHGTSDPALPAARTVRFFDDLAAALHKSAKPQANVRLFLVPGMQACGGGPDQFDTLSAIEAWAEQGKPPDAIAASTPPGAETPHALPLCPYPRMARYSNNGEVTDAANWACGDNQPGRVIAPKTMLLSRANP